MREWQEVGPERELMLLVGISTRRDRWSWDGSEQRTDAISFFFFFLAVPHGMWDLISLAKDETQAPCSGSMEF